MPSIGDAIRQKAAEALRVEINNRLAGTFGAVIYDNGAVEIINGDSRRDGIKKLIAAAEQLPGEEEDQAIEWCLRYAPKSALAKAYRRSNHAKHRRCNSG